mmetsp:Transcript_43627/g.118585  ORF Transcript_43627/g.118585 Transcript_43627/m.118585 type:complete len:442 (-) Transcript_43627:338-1663(-)
MEDVAVDAAAGGGAAASGGGGGGGAAVGGGVPDLVIKVSDPIKNAEGLNSYISYKVNTETTLEEYDYNQFSVIRRYSDFVWLRETLLKSLPGAIIPPLPEKAMMNRFAPEFVEGRRRALERFLNRCAEHPLASKNETFKTFLLADDDKLKKTKEGLKEKTGGYFGSLSSAMTLSTKLEQVKSDQDITFDEIATYVQNLEAQMQNVAKHTAAIVKRGRELAQGLFEFGLAFTLLGQHETEALVTALTQMGHTADQLSLIAAEQVEKEQLWFEEPIVDYIQMLGAVKEALAKRQESRKAYFGRVSDKEHKAASLEKLKAAPEKPGKADKVTAAEGALAAAEEAEEVAKGHFEEVSARALEEMDRFKQTKADDMRKVVLDYVQLQIQYNKRMEQQWALLVPEIEAIDVDQGGAAVPPPAAAASIMPPPVPAADGGAADEDEVGV